MPECRQENLHSQHYAQPHLEVLSALIHFIVMDIIGKFKPSPKGHQYTPTTTWCLPLCTKEADKIVCSYLVNVYSKFCRLHKILSYNDTEF